MDLLTHYLQIILLGIVEGVTEFLPISSTGHLLIAEALGLGQEPDVFNVVIQAGAILAVVFIYWSKIVDLLSHLDRPEARAYLLKIGLAFAVTALVSLVLVKHFHLTLPETLVPVAWATLIGGFVIFAVEYLSKSLYPHEDISWAEAVALGLAQVLAAVFPGASRSGSTIMTGLAFGMKRTSATQFSFLLGIPTMFAASAFDLFRYRKDLTHGGHQLLIDIALGFLVSMVVAFFVVKWLLRFVQSHTFNGFAIYRVLLGTALLIALATHALPDVGSKTEGPTPATGKEAVPTLAPAAVPTTNTDLATPPGPVVVPAPSTETNAPPDATSTNASTDTTPTNAVDAAYPPTAPIPVTNNFVPQPMPADPSAMQPGQNNTVTNAAPAP